MSVTAAQAQQQQQDPKYTVATLTAFDTNGELKTWSIPRRKPQGNDVFIRIQYCGICHSDLHQIRAEWPIDNYYPMTPGHEIVGLVEEIGPDVKKFKIGERVGVGCMVDSCRECEFCRKGEEQYCTRGSVATYNCSVGDKGSTHGGFSQAITVREEFVVHIPEKLPPGEAAPLLCAGITTYSPLVHFGAKEGGPKFHTAVLGLGGLGHVAVKIAKAMGNQVTVLSRGDKKKPFAEKLGAKYIDYNDPKQLESATGKFDLILDTVSADHEVVDFFKLIKTEGKLVIVGLPSSSFTIPPSAVIFRRISFAGSLIGGIRQTQEMLDFCAEHNVTVEVEFIPAKDVNHAMDKLSRGTFDAGRFVIKIAETLNKDVQVEKVANPHQLENRKVMGTIHPPEAKKEAQAQRT